MKKIKILTALLTLCAPVLTAIPVNAEDVTVNNETTVEVAPNDAVTDESELNATFNGENRIKYTGLVDPRESTAELFALAITVDAGQVIDYLSITSSQFFEIDPDLSSASTVVLYLGQPTAIFSIAFDTTITTAGTYNASVGVTDGTAVGMAVASITVASVTTPGTGGELIYQFADPVLADEVASVLGKNLFDQVTAAELASIEYINVSPRYITIAGNPVYTDATSLVGIEQLTGLKTLRLIDTKITDLSPITGLSIENLEIQNWYDYPVASVITNHNQIANLAPTLTKLTLNSQYNVDLGFLSSLTNLEYLNLEYNSLQDTVTSIAGLSNLTRLDIGYNMLDANDIPGMLAPNLTYVNADANGILDVRVFANVDAFSAQEQVVIYTVKAEDVERFKENGFVTDYPVVAVDGGTVVPNQFSTGLGYDAGNNLVTFTGENAAGTLAGVAFHNENAFELDMEDILDDVNDQLSRDFENESTISSYAANQVNAFSGVLVYYFDVAVSNPTETTLPETGINNYGIIAGSGSLALSALAMIARKRIRK